MKQSWINWRILIIDDRSLNFGAKALGLYLNTYMNERHDFAFPSVATVAGEMNISNRVAIKYIKELSDAGYLQKQKRFGKTTVYHATLPEAVENLCISTDKSVSNDESSLVTDRAHSNDDSSLEYLYMNKQENKQMRAGAREGDKSPEQKKSNGASKPSAKTKAKPGQAEIQISKCRFPDRLSKLCRHHGFGDPPSGMAFEQAKAWALRKAQEWARQEKI